MDQQTHWIYETTFSLPAEIMQEKQTIDSYSKDWIPTDVYLNEKDTGLQPTVCSVSGK